MKPNKRLPNQYTLLMIHAEESNLQELIKFLKNTKNIKDQINLKNDTGYTALSMAVKQGNIKIMEELLKHGANPNSSNNASQTAVFVACWNNNLKSLQLLVENGADINTPDKRGWTPLMVAVNKDYSDIAEYLIANGANVDQKDMFGK